MYKQQIEAYFADKEAMLVDAVTRLVSIDSVEGGSAPGAPFGPGPAAALDEALRLAGEWGLITHNHEGYVGTADLNDKPDALHILGHLDVVAPGEGWTVTQPYSPKLVDGMLFGRGVEDDKGPVIASLLAMKAVKDLGVPLKANCRMIMGTNEESGSGDLPYFYKDNAPAPNTVTPDTGFPVYNTEKGRWAPDLSAGWAKSDALPRVAALNGGFRVNVIPGDATALVLGLAVPVLRLIFGADPAWTSWIYRALTFLVISCPCALVISIPLSFFAGIGGASNQGVLVKGSNYLETLSQTKIVVFDKTGTMTKGVFEVSGIHHNEMEDAKLLEYAAYAECSSSHPISKSLQKAYGKPIDRSRVTDIEEIGGNGVIAKVEGVSVAVGNAKLMNRLGIAYKECHHVGTVVHMAVDGKYAGHILISDIIKPHAKEAIENLKKAGITRTVMLTGDGKKVAESVAADLGIGEVHSELLPADKVSKVEELLSNKSEKEKLAFVGDGINDAPVLSRADIGIAMGALGSDAAIEAADVVLMDDDPLKIGKAIRIAKKCMRIVYENIYFAIGVKLICLVLGAFGIANMWVAIFADVGVMVLAVLNAIRTLFVKNL